MSATRPSSPGRLTRRRAQWAVRRALARYRSQMERYRLAVAASDPGDIDGWLFALAGWRQAHAALARAIPRARTLAAAGSALLESGSELNVAAEELLDERRWLAHAAMGYRGDDLQRVHEALAVTPPLIELGMPVMSDPGQSALDLLFPPA